MSNAINVREVLGIEEKRPPLFFDPVGPDRYAAMDRKRITESLFEEWYRKINQTNTRGIPEDIRQLYESATIDGASPFKTFTVSADKADTKFVVIVAAEEESQLVDRLDDIEGLEK